ncbi:hypothetical protein MTP99_011291 [Tenebrio molitor]|nr:hypothetical protein MTP99_011291 [Tenebrio molitor]
MLLVTYFLGATALVVLYRLLKIIFVKTSRVYHVQKLPGPPRYNWIFGNMKPLQSTPVHIFQVLRNWGRSFYPIYKCWVISISVANVICPEDMKLILSDMNHIKKSLAYNLLHKWLGTGLLTSTGSKWQLRRKILTPAFHFNILQDFILTFNEKADELVEVLKRDCDKPYTEISPLMTHFSLKIIGETSMGRKLEFNSEKEKDYKSAFHGLVDILIYRIFRPYFIHIWLYIFTPHFYRELKFVKTLHSFTTEVIAEREKDFHSDSTTQKKRKRLAMLDLLLTAKREEGLIDNEGIRKSRHFYV